MSVRSLRRGAIAASRVAAPVGTTVLRITANGPYASTPDSVANSVTGDIDLRVQLSLDDWTPSTTSGVLVNKYTQPSERTVQWFVSTSGPGLLQAIFSTNGGADLSGASSVATGFTDGTAHWLRVTRVASSGLRTFYTSDDGSAWTQLGTTATPGSGNLFNSTSPLHVWGGTGSGSSAIGHLYYFEMRNGIAGTVVAKFDASTVTPSGVRTPSSFVSATGETWTMNGTTWDWATV